MSTLTVTIIQTALHWEDKAANMQMLEQKINSIQEKTEVIVLPEMFSTGFSMQPEKFAETMPARAGSDGEGETVQWMKRLAAEKKIILTGSFICGDSESGLKDKIRTVQTPADGGVPTRYYNRLVWMLPTGQYGVYDKRHLFAYAGEDKYYTAGSKRLITSVKGWKIHPLVCYDLRFPVWSRQQPQDGGAEYDVLIYVANWPERRSHAWKTLLQARAIENQCYVIGVNRVGNDGNNIYHSGDSMIIDPMGEILYHKKDEEDIFTLKLDKVHLQTVREKLPFLKDADGFKIINNGE